MFIISDLPSKISVLNFITLRLNTNVWNSPINISMGKSCGFHGSFHMRPMRNFLILVLCLQLISCGQSEKQLAAGKLKLAESLYQKGDTIQALAIADSHTCFVPHIGAGN